MLENKNSWPKTYVTAISPSGKTFTRVNIRIAKHLPFFGWTLVDPSGTDCQRGAQ